MDASVNRMIIIAGLSLSADKEFGRGCLNISVGLRDIPSSPEPFFVIDPLSTLASHLLRIPMAEEALLLVGLESHTRSREYPDETAPGSIQDSRSSISCPISKSYRKLKDWERRVAEEIRKGPLEKAAERELYLLKEVGGRVITFKDEDYPKRLKDIYDPPAVLYMQGRIEKGG